MQLPTHYLHQKVTSTFNYPTQNLPSSLQPCTSCSLAHLGEWQHSYNSTLLAAQAKNLGASLDTCLSQLIQPVNLTGSAVKEYPESSHFSPFTSFPAVTWSKPPSACLDPCRSLSLLPLLPLKDYSQLGSRVIYLKLGQSTDFSAQNPALTLRIKYNSLTHVALPAPPQPTPPKPGHPLPLYLPSPPLSSHSLCSNPTGLCCSAPTFTAALLPGIFFPVLSDCFIFLLSPIATWCISCLSPPPPTPIELQGSRDFLSFPSWQCSMKSPPTCASEKLPLELQLPVYSRSHSICYTSPPPPTSPPV